MEQFMQEARRDMLNDPVSRRIILEAIPNEERLEGIPPEERLAGLSPEDIRRAIPPEVLAALQQPSEEPPGTEPPTQ